MFAPAGLGMALHNKSGKVADTHSALANRQFVTSFCTILSNPLGREVIDKADCTRMFQIGDRRMLVAYFRTEFVRRDLLCRAGGGESPCPSGVAFSTTLNPPGFYS